MRAIIDTNLLILYVFGAFKPALVGVHKNCTAFDMIDYRLLLGLMADYTEIICCPNTLTELSNSVRQMAEPDKSHITQHLARIIDTEKEIYIASAEAMEHFNYTRIGLTDAVLLNALDGGVELITVDYDLYISALQQGSKVKNFIHYREAVDPR